jgi:transcriptional regulator with XRE-family HTH domain
VTGNELREIRTRLGLTQEELGKRLGVRKMTVWRWEHEYRHIPELATRLIQYIEKEVRTERQKKTRRPKRR